MSDTIIRSRIDPTVKAEAARVFKSMGLTMSDAIRLFLYQSVAEKRLPFVVKAPNPETVAALEAVERGEGLEPVTLEQLAKDWKDARDS
jgi:DNA-damage-inducible protein J